MYWSPPNFLAVVFKKQEISQQVVTRMQDLASEFSQIFREWYPRTLTAGGGDPIPHPTPKHPGVGTQTLPPLHFSAAVAPLSPVKPTTAVDVDRRPVHKCYSTNRLTLKAKLCNYANLWCKTVPKTGDDIHQVERSVIKIRETLVTT